MPTEQELISYMNERGVPQTERAEWMSQFRRKQAEADTRSRMAQAVTDYPVLGRIGGVVGGVAVGMADTMTAGYAPQIIEKFAGRSAPWNKVAGQFTEPPRVPAEEIRGMMDARMSANPVAGALGKIGGFFVPGPQKLLGQASSRLGAGLLNAATAGKVAKVSAEAGFVGRTLANLATNLAGNIPATGVMRLVEATDEDSDIRARIARAGNDLTNPWGLAFVTGVSGLQAKMTIPRSVELKQIIDKFERVTGERVPIDTLTDDASFQAFFDRLARTPGMHQSVQRVQKRMHEGVISYIDDIAERSGISAGARDPAAAGESVRAAAGQAVRDIAGVRVAKTTGAATSTRRGIQRPVFEAHREDEISSEGVAALRGGVAEIIRGGSRAGERGSFQGVLDSIHKLTDPIRTYRPALGADGLPIPGGGRVLIRRPPALKVKDVEELKQQLAVAAGFEADLANTGSTISKMGRKMARDTYHVVDQLIQNESQPVAAAVKLGEAFRRMEAEFPTQRLIDIDDATARNFWGTKGVLGRVNTVRQLGSPDQLSALKGWLFWDLMRKAVNPKTGAFRVERLKSAFSGNLHNSQVWDDVMPGARQELLEFAQLNGKMFGEGLLAPVGSQTYGRTAGLTPAKISIATAAAVGGILTNPAATIASAIGVGGVMVVVNKASRSLIEGTGQAALQNLARGGPKQPVPNLLSSFSTLTGPTRGPSVRRSP